MRPIEQYTELNLIVTELNLRFWGYSISSSRLLIHWCRLSVSLVKLRRNPEDIKCLVSNIGRYISRRVVVPSREIGKQRTLLRLGK